MKSSSISAASILDSRIRQRPGIRSRRRNNSTASGCHTHHKLWASSNNGCSTTALQAAENSDGDYFFCAASGDNMAPIFKTALGQVSKGVKLLNLPGS